MNLEQKTKDFEFKFEDFAKPFFGLITFFKRNYNTEIGKWNGKQLFKNLSKTAGLIATQLGESYSIGYISKILYDYLKGN
ncbi:MAG: hypothetical protein AABW45_01975 [Nanoarchaeota archaeon]